MFRSKRLLLEASVGCSGTEETINLKGRDMAERYSVSSADLVVVKKAAKYMATMWRPLAARPHLVSRIVKLVAEHGLEEGCEEYARIEAMENSPEYIYGRR